MFSDKITVEVNAEMRVSDETVNRCLKLIQWWLNDNPDKRIVGGMRNADGKIDDLRMETRKEYTVSKGGNGMKKIPDQCETCVLFRFCLDGDCLNGKPCKYRKEKTCPDLNAEMKEMLEKR